MVYLPLGLISALRLAPGDSARVAHGCLGGRRGAIDRRARCKHIRFDEPAVLRLPSRRRATSTTQEAQDLSIARAERQEWRARRASSRPLSPPPNCGPWPSNWPRCARRRPMREWPPMRTATPAMPRLRLTWRWATPTCWTSAMPMRKRLWLRRGERTGAGRLRGFS